VTVDPLVLIPEVGRATERLLTTAGSIDDTTLAGASLLPGWTRGHVLTHLARNADALVNLLTWARTGVETPAYASREAREADIAAGSSRPVAEQVADLREACDRFAAAAVAVPAAGWRTMVRFGSGSLTHAAYVVWARVREVEVHHVDLDAGYGPADWPDSFIHRVLHELCGELGGFDVRLRATDLGHELVCGAGGGPTVSGPGHLVAAWLAGRSDGAGLTVTPDGPLPAVPEWR